MIYGFLLVIHIIVSILLVVSILMQASKGGGMAGIAGTGASSATFGGRSTATALHKVTVGMAIFFAANCLLLGILSKGTNAPRSVVQENPVEDANPLDFIAPAEMPVDAEATQPAGGEAAPVEAQPTE